MPRTFLVERIVDMATSVNGNSDDVTLDHGCHDDSRCAAGEAMTSQRERDVAVATSGVVDYRADRRAVIGQSH